MLALGSPTLRGKLVTQEHPVVLNQTSEVDGDLHIGDIIGLKRMISTVKRGSAKITTHYLIQTTQPNRLSITVDGETVAKQELLDFEEGSGGVRRITRSSLDKEHPLYKKMKLEVPTVDQCSTEEAAEINRLLIAAVCERGWHFSIVDKKEGQENGFVHMLRKLRPGYVDRFLPSSQKLWGELLDSYFDEIKGISFSGMRSRLQSGFGTVIFDAWEDTNSSTVVTVLLRSEGQQRCQQLTFFVESVFTGSTTAGAEKYVQVVENAVEPLVGMERICGVG
ncbi:hypothetical protein FGB62_56g07 [Gracilaria domingensis]|nr:hypothetical protein FGB62_428g01 [Gracilaria domingensis]KAI0562639.1 hypothetical protein FGB62_56g07 [Gracilaria domingensis]